jgi:hypothetical protein
LDYDGSVVSPWYNNRYPTTANGKHPTSSQGQNPLVYLQSRFHIFLIDPEPDPDF